MKFKIIQFQNPSIIHPAKVHKMNVKLVNLTANELPLPNEYFTPASYSYDLDNGLIVGNRSCLVEGQIYIDTPAEWNRQEFLSYITRVKKTHTREFSFISDYSEESGEGVLQIPRPYIHIEEDIFFCGCVEYWNFGFFLTVLMQKIFIALTIDSARPILVPVGSAWQVTLLKVFFPKANLIFYDPSQVVSFARATVIGWPGFGFHIQHDYINYLQAIVESGDMDGAVDRPRICFARRDGQYAKRFEMTKLLSEYLMSQRYVALYPELLPPDKIAKMVSGSKSVILDSGSALFNLVFAKPKVNVTLFESRTEFLLNHSRFLNSCGMNSQVLFVDPSSRLSKVKMYIPGVENSQHSQL